MATTADLAEELEVVLDYAQLDIEFEAEAGEAEGTSIVTLGGVKYYVDTDKALELIKETPDHAKGRDIINALNAALHG
jgi:hypothetical protein